MTFSAEEDGAGGLTTGFLRCIYMVLAGRGSCGPLARPVAHQPRVPVPVPVPDVGPPIVVAAVGLWEAAGTVCWRPRGVRRAAGDGGGVEAADWVGHQILWVVADCKRTPVQPVRRICAWLSKY